MFYRSKHHRLARSNLIAVCIGADRFFVLIDAREYDIFRLRKRKTSVHFDIDQDIPCIVARLGIFHSKFIESIL